jgi:hypothetical protein
MIVIGVIDINLLHFYRADPNVLVFRDIRLAFCKLFIGQHRWAVKVVRLGHHTKAHGWFLLNQLHWLPLDPVGVAVVDDRHVGVGSGESVHVAGGVHTVFYNINKDIL